MARYKFCRHESAAVADGAGGSVGALVVCAWVSDDCLRATGACRRDRQAKEGLAGALHQQQFGQRFATTEPVFGNIRHNKRLNQFTLRGRSKVDGQWKLYALVHNIEKWANFRKAA